MHFFGFVENQFCFGFTFDMHFFHFVENQRRRRDIAKHQVQLDRKRNKALAKIASMVE